MEAGGEGEGVGEEDEEGCEESFSAGASVEGLKEGSEDVTRKGGSEQCTVCLQPRILLIVSRGDLGKEEAEEEEEEEEEEEGEEEKASFKGLTLLPLPDAAAVAERE